MLSDTSPFNFVAETRPYRRPRRKASWLTAVFYLSSLLPAAGIAWYYDLPNAVDRRLNNLAPESAQYGVPSQAPPTLRRTRPRDDGQLEPGESRAQAPPEAPAPVAALAQPAPKTFVSDLARGQGPTPNEVAPIQPTIVSHTIDLDLTSRRQRYHLCSGEVVRLSLVSLKGCDASYDFIPMSGLVNDRQKAAIAIHGPRKVVLKISVDSRRSDTCAIVIEPQIRTGDGDLIPFTIANIERRCRGVVRNGEAAAAHLAALELERADLKVWICAPVAKPLAARGQARGRLMLLDNAISRQAKLVKALEADLEVAKVIYDLAMQLHNDCQLQIAEIESEQSG